MEIIPWTLKVTFNVTQILASTMVNVRLLQMVLEKLAIDVFALLELQAGIYILQLRYRLTAIP